MPGICEKISDVYISCSTHISIDIYISLKLAISLNIMQWRNRTNKISKFKNLRKLNAKPQNSNIWALFKRRIKIKYFTFGLRKCTQMLSALSDFVGISREKGAKYTIRFHYFDLFDFDRKMVTLSNYYHLSCYLGYYVPQYYKMMSSSTLQESKYKGHLLYNRLIFWKFAARSLSITWAIKELYVFLSDQLIRCYIFG